MWLIKIIYWWEQTIIKIRDCNNNKPIIITIENYYNLILLPIIITINLLLLQSNIITIENNNKP
jgi:hypothetical protein